MHFVFPQFLWALLLVIIPILIHLFNFRKHKQVYFSSLQFVKSIETSDRKRRNVLHLLLLSCRILALVFIVLAFAQPYFPKDNSTQNGEKIYAIYVDNSYSMSLNGISGHLLNEAKENARQLILQLPADAKIILSSNRFSGEEGNVSNKQEALSRLDYLTFTPLSKTKEEIITWQKLQAFISHPNAQLHHYLLSDFQKKDSRLEKISSDSVHYYYPLLFVAQEKKNLTVDTVYFESPIHQQGVTTTLVFGVRNYSNSAVKDVELSMEVGAIKRNLTIDIPANSRKEERISYVDFSPGWVKGVISVKDQPFENDNDLYFSYEIKEEIKIALFSSPDAYKEIPSLFALDKHYSVKSHSINSINNEMVLDNDLIILNGIHTFSSDVIKDISLFSNQGGSVFIIPSLQSDFTSYNTLLSSLQMPSFHSLQKEKYKITQISQKDPFFKGVFTSNTQDVHLPGVNSYFKINGYSKSTALPLITLQNQAPLFLRHSTKPTYLINTAIEGTENPLAKDALFPILLLRIAEQASQSSYLYTTIGASGFAPIQATINSTKSLILQKEDIQFIPQRIEKDRSFYLNLSDETAIQQLTSGIYQLKQDNKDLDVFALNLDRSESDIAAFSLNEITTIFKDKGIKNISGFTIDSSSSKIHIPVLAEKSWWRICLLLSLVFILCEIALIVFTKRIRRKEK